MRVSRSRSGTCRTTGPIHEGTCGKRVGIHNRPLATVWTVGDQIKTLLPSNHRHRRDDTIILDGIITEFYSLTMHFA